MRKTLLLFSILWIVVSSFQLIVSQDKCPICNHPQQWTGETRAEYGKILYEQKCILNHSFWIPRASSTPQEQQQASGDCKCPVCGFHGYNTENIKVKKCINGHEFGCN